MYRILPTGIQIISQLKVLFSLLFEYLICCLLFKGKFYRIYDPPHGFSLISSRLIKMAIKEIPFK